jgi:ribosomal-protein-alanine N-acetyltransferase
MEEETLDTPRLETKRLILRPLSLKDTDFLLRHFSDEDVNMYSSYQKLEREGVIDFYKKFIEPGRPTRFRLGIMLKETGELVGTLGYHNLSKIDHSAEIGYDLEKAYWGKGIMTEAVEALTRYGFERMNLNRIAATADSENSRSIRLLERSGFLKEGLLRDHCYYKGRFHDEVIYSLLQKDWEQRRISARFIHEYVQ